MRGRTWESCPNRWALLGEEWTEWYVVSAIGKPLEKWRRVEQFEITGVREGSVDWELVWRSPFSNKLSDVRPEPPNRGFLKSSHAEDDREVNIRCKISRGQVLFGSGVEGRLLKYFQVG